MTGLFVKLDASYHDDPKVCEVSAEAELLYVRLLCYCKRLGNDGSLHVSRVTSVTPTFRVTLDPLELLAELTSVGLLERTETGWRVTSWLRHNPTPEDIDRSREQARLRKQAQRDRERASRNGHAVTGHVTRDQPEPEPEPLVGRVSRSKRGTAVAPDAVITDAMRRYATDHKVDPDKEFGAWRDWHLAKGDAIKDHEASFRMWVRKAVEMGTKVAPLRPAPAPAPSRDHLALSYDWRQAPE